MPSLPLVCAMCVTPFTSSGVVDEAALRRQVRFLIERGAGIFLAAPGAGEGRILSREDRAKLYKAAVQEANAKSPVVAGAIENQTTPWTIEWVKLAVDNGADILQLYGPEHADPAAKTFEQDFERELRMVLESTHKPFILGLYSHNRAALMPVGVAQRLVRDYPQIQGVTLGRKFDAAYQKAIVDSLGAKVTIRLGGGNLLEVLAGGAKGFLGYEPTLAPKRYVAAVERYHQGDQAGAKALLEEFAPLQAALSKQMSGGGLPLPRALRVVLNALGLNQGDTRHPGPLDPAVVRELTQALEASRVQAFEGV